jgi:hypothetical protein
MKTPIKYAMIALMLAAFGLCAHAQEKKSDGGKTDGEQTAVLAERPSSLDNMLALALESNPDILVAEADLHHAQAVARQTRLEVSRMLVEAFLQRRAMKENLEIVKERLSGMEMLVETGQMRHSELLDHKQELTSVEAGLAEIEAVLRSLAGVDPASGRKLGTLEEALELALEANGEIVLAEADLVRMDTRLNRMRLQVMEEVTITFQTRRSLEYALDSAHKAHHRAQERVKQGVVPEEERLAAFQHLIEIEVELNSIEAHLRFLLGIDGTAGPVHEAEVRMRESGEQAPAELAPSRYASLWTSGDPDVARNVCFMYTHNARKQKWFDEVTLIVWGPSANLLAGDGKLQDQVKAMMKDGVAVQACRACADIYGVTQTLENLGIEVKYMGSPMSRMLKEGVEFLTF